MRERNEPLSDARFGANLTQRRGELALWLQKWLRISVCGIDSQLPGPQAQLDVDGVKVMDHERRRQTKEISKRETISSVRS